MKEYTFESLKAGTQETFSAKITEEMMSRFLEISGDTNPLHQDDTFAAGRGFKAKVVYGLLTSSLYSTLIGVYLPGKNALLHGISIKFKKPVFVGDSLTVSGKVSHINEAFKVIEIKAAIENQDGSKVSTATITAGLLE